MCVHACVVSLVQLFAMPCTVTQQTPLSIFQAKILEWIAISYSRLSF